MYDDGTNPQHNACTKNALSSQIDELPIDAFMVALQAKSTRLTRRSLPRPLADEPTDLPYSPAYVRRSECICKIPPTGESGILSAYLFLAETRSDRYECTRNTHLAIRPTVAQALHQLVL
jgi:hypothetical protein